MKNIMGFWRTVIISLFILIFLTACGLLGSPPQESEKTLQSEPLPEHWSVRGRISVVTEKDNWYSSFNWLQEQEDLRIRFTGPMGQTELELYKKNQQVILKTPSYQKQSDNLEQLLSQETGGYIPVKSLRYWVLGKADNAIAATVKYNEQQQISEILQAGWQIQYLRYQQVEQYLLPRKIVLNNADMAVKIKLIVTNWLLGEAALN